MLNMLTNLPFAWIISNLSNMLKPKRRQLFVSESQLYTYLADC
jgi:hypothetical protein